MTDSRRAEPRILTRSFALLVSGHFLQALGYATMPLLPLYLAWLGASRAEIGTIMALAAIGGLTFRPLVAWALDTIGRRTTLLVGTAILTTAMFGLGGVDEIGWWIYADRILFGIGVGTLFSGYFALASDIVPVERRTEGLALFGVSGLVPLIANPIVTSAGIDAPSLRWFFPAVGLLIGASALFLLQIEEPERDAERPPLTLRGASDALRALRMQPVWFATIIFSGFVAIFLTFATVAADARGAANPAALWFTYAGGAAVVRLAGARLPDRLGTSNLVAPSLAVYTMAMVLVARGESDLAFLGAGLLAGVGHGYCFPVLTSQVVTRAPIEVRGTALAAFTAIWELSRLVLTPLVGKLADLYGDRMMFATVAMAGLVGLVVWAVLEHVLGHRLPTQRR